MTDFDRGEPSAGRLLSPVGQEEANPSWKLSFPHVCVAIISSFLFGYHLGVVNEPLESIAKDLGFSGNTLDEGLVVSICLGGAFLGCSVSGWIADAVGRRRAFQLMSLLMIIGASISASANKLQGMLLGRFIVGLGMGLGPPVASLYVTEVSPSFVRGTYGSLVQIATCLGLIATLFMGFPVKRVPRWWRVCFWVSTIPAAVLAILIEFCAESPPWLYKRGRVGEAEAELERLLGAFHVKSAMTELSRSDKGDDVESVKFSDLLHGHNFKVIGNKCYILLLFGGL